MSTEANEKPATGRHVPKHAPRQPRRIDGTMIVGFVAGALIAIGIAAASLLGNVDTRQGVTPSDPAQRGLACPALEEAAAAFDEGDLPAFRDAVKEAARIAERTLETSGQVFGVPERTALTLRSTIRPSGLQSKGVGKLLGRTEQACWTLYSA
jgi:hypothetical protein